MWHLRRLMDLPIRDHRRDTLLFVRRRNLYVFLVRHVILQERRWSWLSRVTRSVKIA